MMSRIKSYIYIYVSKLRCIYAMFLSRQLFACVIHVVIIIVLDCRMASTIIGCSRKWNEIVSLILSCIHCMKNELPMKNT